MLNKSTDHSPRKRLITAERDGYFGIPPMTTLQRTFFILLFANPVIANIALSADPIVVNVWPGKAPGDIGIKGEEKSRIHNSPIVGPTKLITNVSQPTLTI